MTVGVTTTYRVSINGTEDCNSMIVGVTTTYRVSINGTEDCVIV